MSGTTRRTRIAILVIVALLVFSVLGKWGVCRVFLGEDDSGRQRIEAAEDRSADQSGS
jgi:hypothetical protein